ncbi:MAG: STT3 domain-containing protein, partial [Candidatus Omnitrophica bacterium]|nr:STT3 domain-containing protein [Candidatus Omnitrophota bacterium]
RSCLSRWGNLSAVISCLYVGLAPIFLPRSSAGWFDTDILNLLFPLLIVWTYLIAYEKANLKSAVVYVCFSAFWLGVFCLTWINWWFIFCIIVLYEIVSLAGLLFGCLWGKKEAPALFKRHFLFLGCFLIFSFLWIIIFSGPGPFFDIFNSISRSINLNKPLANLVWPNIYSTVDELRKPSFYEIINQAGGMPLFVPGVCCILLLFWRHLRNQKCTVFESGLRPILFLWFAAMFFASSRGIRFVMFMLIPLGISLGWIINEAYVHLGAIKRYLRNIPLIICVVLCVKMLDNGARSAEKLSPLMNDTYYKMLTAIKERTPPESIINSWWDLGDWYKAVSRRRVIIDGQSQNVPQTYWMARALLSDNEEEAIRILKMLDNGGNRAFELMNAYFHDPLKAVFVLNKILSSSPKETQELMLRLFPRPLALRLTELILSKPKAEAYFVADYNIKNIIRSISFIGNWDFKKSYLAYHINSISKPEMTRRLSEFIRDGRQIESLYRQAELVPKDGLGKWASSSWRFRSDLVKGRKTDGIVLFDNGLVYDTKKQEVFLHPSEYGEYKIPESLFFLENNVLKEIVYPRHDLDYSVLILNNQDGFQAILLDTQLAKSLFVRLYFLNGTGLKHFRPFMEERSGDGYIRVFQINWE